MLREAKHLDGHNQPTTRARNETLQACPQPKREIPVSITSKFPKLAKAQGLPNPKGALKEWCDRKWTEKGDAILRYETKETPGGFRSVVHIVKLKLRFEGEVARSKKLAEVAAAEAALAHEEVAPQLR